MNNIQERIEKQKKSDIRINKKMRLWNQFKYYIGGCGVLFIILVIVLTKGLGKESKNPNSWENITPTFTTQETQSEKTTATDVTETAQATSAPLLSGVYTTTKTLSKEDFTSSEFFKDAVFLGDAIVNGIGYYGYLDAKKVVSDLNMTTDKAVNYVDELATSNPNKVFILLGINDLNYGTRSVDTIVSNYNNLINSIKSKLPSAKIYMVSVLPITQTYESKANVYIKKSNLDELNNRLKSSATTWGINYLDAAPLFSNESGYLNDTVTTSGINLKSDYYGLFLNTIADMLK